MGGLVFLLFPLTIRKYDTRMTRYVKNADGYRAMTIAMGGMLIVMAIAALIIGLFGLSPKIK